MDSKDFHKKSELFMDNDGDTTSDEHQLIEAIIFDSAPQPQPESHKLVAPIIFDNPPPPQPKAQELVAPIIFDNPPPPQPKAQELVAPIIFDGAPSEKKLVSADFTEITPRPEHMCIISSGLKGYIERRINNNDNYASYVDNRSMALMQIYPASLSPAIPARGMPAPGIRANYEKPRPYDVAQKVKTIYTLRVVGDCLYKFSGKCYQYLPMNEVYTLIYEVCEQEVALVGNDSIIKGAYSLLMADPDLRIRVDKPEGNYAVFENGMLRLSDGVLLAHTSELFLTTAIRACYVPENVYCPKFDQFLHDFTDGDVMLAERLLQMIGYCITPDLGAKVFFDLHGPSGTGKSTVLELLRLFFDLTDVTSIELAEMRNPFTASELIGKALCFSPDLTDKPLDSFVVGLIKRMTGGDLITADRKYQARAKFYNAAKLIIVRNGVLRTEKPDPAFLERVVTIPCHRVVPAETRKNNFAQQLVGEVNAIATKAIQAYFRLRANHYRFAGDFQINDMTDNLAQDSEETSVSLEDCVKSFLMKHYEPCPEGVVFTEDVCKEFATLHPELNSDPLLRSIGKQMETLFNAKKSRKRRPGHKNPQSCVLGIRRIVEGGSSEQ